MNKIHFIHIVLLSIFIFQAGCKEKSPVEPTKEEYIVTVERELADGQEPAVSPDGKKIAYTYNGSIYVMDTSGANVAQLTSGSTDVLPRWHPNGQTVGFIRSTPGIYNQGVLYSVPASGGGATQLVLNHFIADSLIQASRVWGNIAVPIWEWSPDGNYIAFFSTSADTSFLNVVSLISGNSVFTRQTYIRGVSSGHGHSFAWSSELNKIAFISSNEHRYGAAYLYDITAHSQQIDSIHDSPRFITEGVISNKFAYSVMIDSSSTTGYWGAWLAVSDLKTPSFGYYPAHGLDGLKWSSDEKYFLYEIQGAVGGAFAYKYSRLFLYSVETLKEYPLTLKGDINLHDYFFEWSKLSNAVYFERFNKICVVSFSILK